MQQNKIESYIKEVLKNMPSNWLQLTTHRLDIYNESLAKNEFLEYFNNLFQNNIANRTALENLPTAYDYIRLGHPLSCILEWTIANKHGQNPTNVISFASQTAPILAILRKNLLDNTRTKIFYINKLPDFFDPNLIKNTYGYNFEIEKIATLNDASNYNGTSILVSQERNISSFERCNTIDFFVNYNSNQGSIVIINGKKNDHYISEIQHVRRRETIAMTPIDALSALQSLVDKNVINSTKNNTTSNKKTVLDSIKTITKTNVTPLVASSGLSMQYAIMMGLIAEAQKKYPEKSIQFIVPPNCYGGTNDQARRVAACIQNVEIVDLPVDGDNDMTQSIDGILNTCAIQDTIPYIIAEIPTNPRVEVPNLEDLRNVLTKKRYTQSGKLAIDPVFILDQTFCPDVLFLSGGNVLSKVKTIAYVSGSKFPSGGKCTAGYCVANDQSKDLMANIAKHLQIFDNEATPHQYKILANEMPSMNKRIEKAYQNTREFVNFIQQELPDAKINFVSNHLAQQGFKPSVFSLDLPTKGNSEEERETYKRALNLRLINKMITKIPEESKFCVSYGQLKGCYWTIPATSTQGTTKESDKDYIVRCSLSPKLNLELHKKVFADFVNEI